MSLLEAGPSFTNFDGSSSIKSFLFKMTTPEPLSDLVMTIFLLECNEILYIDNKKNCFQCPKSSFSSQKYSNF